MLVVRWSYMQLQYSRQLREIRLEFHPGIEVEYSDYVQITKREASRVPLRVEAAYLDIPFYGSESCDKFTIDRMRLRRKTPAAKCPAASFVERNYNHFVCVQRL